jgi:hypothetical protein
MTNAFAAAAFVALLTPLAPLGGTATAPVASGLSFKGPAWIAIEYPVNPYDATTKNAFLAVRTYHHGTVVEFPVSGTAEGIVNGERRTIKLEFTKTSQPGLYALRKQWRDDGVWTLVIAVTQGTEDLTQAVVELAANGTIASVNVPTRQQGEWKLPARVVMSDIDAGLRARSAVLARR